MWLFQTVVDMLGGTAFGVVDVRHGGMALGQVADNIRVAAGAEDAVGEVAAIGIHEHCFGWEIGVDKLLGKGFVHGCVVG